MRSLTRTVLGHNLRVDSIHATAPQEKAPWRKCQGVLDLSTSEAFNDIHNVGEHLRIEPLEERAQVAVDDEALVHRGHLGKGLAHFSDDTAIVNDEKGDGEGAATGDEGWLIDEELMGAEAGVGSETGVDSWQDVVAAVGKLASSTAGCATSIHGNATPLDIASHIRLLPSPLANSGQDREEHSPPKGDDQP